MLYSNPSFESTDKKGVAMLKNISASAQTSAPFDALSFDATSTYSFTATKPKWFTNRDYAHFGDEALGVNG